MSIERHADGEHPHDSPQSPPPTPTAILAIAAACAVATGYLTDWDTAATVFISVLSLFTRSRTLRS